MSLFLTFNAISYNSFLAGCVDALVYVNSSLYSILLSFHPFALLLGGLLFTVVVVGFFKLL